MQKTGIRMQGMSHEAPSFWRDAVGDGREWRWWEYVSLCPP